MANRNNPLYWSFGLGSWFGVRVRVSWLMPVVLAWLLFEFKLELGAAIFVGLTLSVLLHEFGHILAARAMDGSGDEILIWPLGGLAFVGPSSTPLAQCVTSIGGPAVNLLLCGLFFPAAFASNHLSQALNPLALAVTSDDFCKTNVALDLQLLMFSLNWMILLINLLPVYPLDGGQALRSWLKSRLGGALATEISVRCGYVAGGVLALLAMLVFKHVILLAIAFLIVLLALEESFQLQAGESYDDSFMGYDFSQGYTSLDRANLAKDDHRPGVLTRWLDARRVEKQRRIEQQQLEVEQQLDAILAKVHEQGMAALSPSERRLLKRASDRFRSKGQDPS